MTPQKQWRKSSYTGANGNCVELHQMSDKVRDSKNHEVLPLDRRAVAGLLRAVKADER